MRSHCSIVALAIGLLGAAPAPAQEVLDLMRAQYPDHLGHVACGLGDLDLDGFGDFAIGALPHSISNRPVIAVHSGADRSILYEIPTVLGQRRITLLNRTGDVNQDGFEDFLAGDWNLNGVEVRSGLDGALLYSFFGPPGGSHFGWAASGAGDVDADGHDDVVIGARGYQTGIPSSTYVYSGRTGGVLHHFRGSNYRDQFGSSVAGIGDVDLDGHDDVLVGAFSHNAPGMIGAGGCWVYSGRDGSVLHHRVGLAADRAFGNEAYALGDVNRDGVPDFVVGDTVTYHAPRYYVFSGVDASLLYSVEGREKGFRQSSIVDTHGDLDGDGIRDLLVGRSHDPGNGLLAGSVTIHSGEDGSILQLLDGPEEDSTFGSSVAFVGNLNGDAADDFVIGAPKTQGRAPPYYDSAGAVFVVAAGPPHDLLLLAPTVGREAGHAEPICVQRATPGGTVHLAHSFTGLGTTILTGFQVELALHGARPLGSAIASAAGVAEFPIAVPDRFRGRTVWLQAFEPSRVSNWAQRLIYWPWNWE